ncbi:MAG: YraN family protein [Bacteroidales bacterium]
MAQFHETGKRGEEMAKRFLENGGHEILETNWRSGHHEVDIIAKKDETIIIVEVKTRKTNFFGEPEEFVTKNKQRLLIKAANSYILKNNIDLEVRFDIISVLYSGSNHKIHHIKDAFYPTL